MSAKAVKVLFTCCGLLLGLVSTVGMLGLLADTRNDGPFQVLAWMIITLGWTLVYMLVRVLYVVSKPSSDSVAPTAPS